MKDKSKLINVIKKHYEQPFNELLISEIRSSIRLKTYKKNNFKLGETKLGGIPHLPQGINWPKDKNKKFYSFIAQINLDEVSEFDLEGELPKNGILFFFYDIEIWDSGKIIYSESTDELSIPEPPTEILKEIKTLFQRIFKLSGQKKILEECGVKIYNEYYIPSQDSLQFERLLKINKLKNIPNNIMKEEVYENELLYNPDEGEMTSNHHLLGNYNGIQFEFYQLELIKVKYNIKRLTLDQINKALEWKLLLQIDSDDNLKINWADWGKIYFFVNQNDLRKENFENIKIIGDCY